MPRQVDEHEAEEILKEINHLAYKLAHNPPLSLYRKWGDDIDMWTKFLEDHGYRILKSDFPLSYDVFLPAWRNVRMQYATTSGEYPSISAQQGWIPPQPQQQFDLPNPELWTKQAQAKLANLEYQAEEIQFRMLKSPYNHNEEVNHAVEWLTSCSPEQAMDYLRLILSRVVDHFKRFIKKEPD